MGANSPGKMAMLNQAKALEVKGKKLTLKPPSTRKEPETKAMPIPKDPKVKVVNEKEVKTSAKTSAKKRKK